MVDRQVALVPEVGQQQEAGDIDLIGVEAGEPPPCRTCLEIPNMPL